jgi:hypothetical protein
VEEKRYKEQKKKKLLFFPTDIVMIDLKPVAAGIKGSVIELVF